jgi:hypothetical protein
MSKAARPTLSIPSKAAEAPAPAPVVEDTTPEPQREDREPVKPVEVTVNPRHEALDRLAAQAAIETGHDGAIPLNERSHLEHPAEDDGLPDDPTDPYLPISADEPTPNGGAPAAAAPAESAPAPEPKKYVVDARGVKAEVPEDQVIEAGLHALRHHGAAELALREANALLAQARGIAPAAPAPAPQGQAPASTPDDALRLAEALQFGSKEDAAKAVAAMMNRGVASEDVNEVVARTVETRVRDVLDQDKAAKQLETLVPEMLTDRRVLALMATEERAARAAGDTRPYTQLYPEIGQKIRSWLDGFKTPAAPAAAGAATPIAPAIAARQAAKAAVPAPVIGRGAAPAEPAQTRAPTGSEIVAQMRASRGKRQYI